MRLQGEVRSRPTDGTRVCGGSPYPQALKIRETAEAHCGGQTLTGCTGSHECTYPKQRMTRVGWPVANRLKR